MGELRIQRLRYTIAGLIFAMLLRESTSLPWLKLDGAPLSSLFADGAWLQVAGVAFGGAFALWGVVPIERRWPLVVVIAVAAITVFFVALNIVDPEGRVAITPFGVVGAGGADVTYAPGLLLAAAASIGAFVVALWTLRDDLVR